MLKYILPVLCLSIFVAAQDKKEDIIAKAGSIGITLSEFQERFQLNPQVSIHRLAQGEANKKIFLYGLIAEKLLALEAKEGGLDTSATVKYFLKNFEKMFVRDELYRRVITSRSAEYAENLLSFYLENSSRIFSKTIFSKNKDKVRSIYNLLAQGVQFDSVYIELAPAEKDTITLYSGTLDERTEKEIFSLPEKHFSKPMEYNKHWVIFYIENKNDPVIAKSMGWESEYKRLERISKEKAEAVYYKQFMENFFAGKKVDAKGFFVKSLGERITSLVSETAKEDTGSYFLSAADIVKITHSYSADSLGAPFIFLDNDTLSFNDFLLWMRTEVFEIKEKSYESITSLVNSKVKRFIEYELLAQEGNRQGLDKSENVKKNLAMWRDNYLYELQLSLLSDSFISFNNHPELVKVAEFKSNDLAVIETVLNESASGKDFMSIMQEFSSSVPDTSYRSVASLTEIKDEVLQAKTGDIVGPVKTSNGYIIFKVLDKKISETAGVMSEAGEVKNPFDKHIAELAEKYGVTLNEEMLPEISNSNINAVIFKYLGFGGRVPAVPLLNPIPGWYQEWKKEVQLNP